MSPFSFLFFDFHRISQLGRFGLVVAMSVCLFVCCLSPSHAFFFAWTGASLVLGVVRIVPLPCVEEEEEEDKDEEDDEDKEEDEDEDKDKDEDKEDKDKDKNKDKIWTMTRKGKRTTTRTRTRTKLSLTNFFLHLIYLTTQQLKVI